MESPRPSRVTMLTTVASSSTACEKPKSDSRAPPIDTTAPTIGMPAATKPPKTKNITMKRERQGDALAAQQVSFDGARDRLDHLARAADRALGAHGRRGPRASAARPCVSASAWAALARPGSKSTTVTNPPEVGLPPLRSGATDGSVRPRGDSSGDRTFLTPGTRAISRVAAAPLSTVAASVRSAPVTCIVSVSRAGWLWAMTSWAREDSDSTVGAPECSRSKRDSPVTPPTATAKHAIAMTAHAATQLRGWRAMSRRGGPDGCAAPGPRVRGSARG